MKLLKFAVALTAILLIIDILNLPSRYLGLYDVSVVFIGIGAVILILSLTVLEFNILDTFKMVSINFVDSLSIVIIISCIMYGSISAIYSQLFIYKLFVIIGISSLFFVIILVRGIRLKRSITDAEKYQPNVVDLKEIFTGDFMIKIKKDETILVNEKDVDYDLLERGKVINQLYYAILQSNPDGRFVISLEGKWGCGKTTIINNVKRKLAELNQNIVIIDEFDPWSYCDQESLFFNMFDIILQKSGLKYSTLLTKQMVDKISENIFGSRKTSMIFGSFLFKQTNNTSVIKNKINDYLKLCGKKVVFFIDNIDRAENENIILLFKLVGNVFDFERVTYVLSFDNVRVKKIFDDKLSLDYEYLKKVIQMQIRVPEVDRNLLARLFTRCIHNLLIAYGENHNNLDFYNSIISCMCKQTIDVRDFKRFINSVLSISFREGSYLNKRDLLVIEYIRLYNLTLYQQIYQNRSYFISHDKIVDSEIYRMSFNKKDFNVNAKNYFKNLFSDETNYSFLSILKEIFPYVKKYKENQELECDGLYVSDGTYSDIAKNRRICSAKYFDLYFTNTENEFLLIEKLVQNFVDSINQMINLEDGLLIFSKFLTSVQPIYHKEIFERFQLYIEDLQENVAFNMVSILFSRINEIDDSPAFFALDARKRIEVIIWELLQKITDDHFNEFLTNINKDYRKMENIGSILYWFEHDREGKNIDGRKQKMETMYQEMGSSIINNSINLYDDLYYFPKNVWGLCRIYKDDQVKIQDYIKKVINEKSIFRLLYDIIGFSYGTKFKYSISKGNLDCLTTEEEIDEILKKTVPISRDQQFVFDVYKNYKDGITDEWGKTGVVTDEVQNLKL